MPRFLLVAALLAAILALATSLTVAADRIEIKGPGGASVTVQRPVLRSVPWWRAADAAPDAGST